MLEPIHGLPRMAEAAQDQIGCVYEHAIKVEQNGARRSSQTVYTLVCRNLIESRIIVKPCLLRQSVVDLANAARPPSRAVFEKRRASVDAGAFDHAAACAAQRGENEQAND